MSDFEIEAIKLKDEHIQLWMGEIRSDKSLYENIDFDWFAWAVKQRQELNESISKLHLGPVIHQARADRYNKANTATIIELPLLADTSFVTAA